MKKYFIAILSVVLLISCEKEIDIDLNKSNPKFVIEGNISNLPGECKVKISKTINFNEVVPNPTVSGALVIITDNNTNQADTLIEIKPGFYAKFSLIGKEGHNYTLIVKVNNETFSASSSMPYMVKLDTVEQIDINQGGHGGPMSGGIGGNSIIRIIPTYTDPANVENYFQFVLSKNDTVLNDIFIQSDFGFNGIQSNRPLRVKADKKDIIKIDMQCIDKPVYNYFFGLNENINQSSATPANPVSNINNNALGYFKAHTSSSKILTIK
ncbi:MAG: DUF4249 family protein [Bacteroidales bacterium]